MKLSEKQKYYIERIKSDSIIIKKIDIQQTTERFRPRVYLITENVRDPEHPLLKYTYSGIIILGYNGSFKADITTYTPTNHYERKNITKYYEYLIYMGVHK